MPSHDWRLQIVTSNHDKILTLVSLPLSLVPCPLSLASLILCAFASLRETFLQCNTELPHRPSFLRPDPRIKICANAMPSHDWRPQIVTLNHDKSLTLVSLPLSLVPLPFALAS